MKKILYLIIFIITILPAVQASEQDAMKFFNRYVTLSNQWSLEVVGMYSANPVIKRLVLNNNPVLVTVPFSEQKKILEYYNKHKFLLKGVRNDYKSVRVNELGNGKYKISAQRCPSMMKSCFNSYMIIQKQNGEYKLVEEYSEVKSKYFLRYGDKK